MQTNNLSNSILINKLFTNGGSVRFFDRHHRPGSVSRMNESTSAAEQQQERSPTKAPIVHVLGVDPLVARG
jgi:hypothetical protein